MTIYQDFIKPANDNSISGLTYAKLTGEEFEYAHKALIPIIKEKIFRDEILTNRPYIMEISALGYYHCRQGRRTPSEEIDYQFLRMKHGQEILHSLDCVTNSAKIVISDNSMPTTILWTDV